MTTAPYAEISATAKTPDASRFKEGFTALAVFQAQIVEAAIMSTNAKSFT